MTRNEIKAIPEFPGYFIDLDGTVYSTRSTQPIRKLSVFTDMGYPSVSLNINGRKFNRSVSSLLKQAFPNVIVDAKTLEVKGFVNKVPLSEMPVVESCSAQCPLIKLMQPFLEFLAEHRIPVGS